MSNINAFLFGFTNMFNADIRKHSNEEYNAKFEKITKQK